MEARRRRTRGLPVLAVMLAVMLAVGGIPRGVRAATVSGGSTHNAIVLVLDRSGSMYGTKIQKLREATKEFAKKILEADPESKIAIVAFDSGTQTMDFTSSESDIETYADALTSGGNTSVKQALAKADEVASALQDADDAKYVKSIVTMSDGQPTDSKANATSQAEGMFDSYSMYSVGFQVGDTAREFLKGIQNSGYFDADDLDSLVEKFVQIAEEMLNPVSIDINYSAVSGTTNQFDVTATVSNPNAKTVKGMTVEFSTSDGATLTTGDWAQSYGDLAANSSAEFHYVVTAADGATSATVSVTVKGDNIVDLTQERKIVIGSSEGDHAIDLTNGVWSFPNSRNPFTNYQLNYTPQADDFQALLYGLRPADRSSVVECAKLKWIGSCYGLAATVILNEMGVTTPLSRQEGATRLWDMQPTASVLSYVNYYFLMQALDVNQQLMASFVSLSESAKVKTLKDEASQVANGGTPVLLCFRYVESGESCGHAIVADGYEDGDWNLYLGSMTHLYKYYNGRVHYYDCNSLMGYESGSPYYDGSEDDLEGNYIYINTDTGDWWMPNHKNHDGYTVGLGYEEGTNYLNYAMNRLPIISGGEKDVDTAVDNYRAILKAERETLNANWKLDGVDASSALSNYDHWAMAAEGVRLPRA